MLAVATGWTLDYIDSLPRNDFFGMQALNYIEPYTHEFQSQREGLLLTETYNARRKKPISMSELLPYTNVNNLGWLVDDCAEKAKVLITRHEHNSKVRGVAPDYNYVRRLITEEISSENEKLKPDMYKIRELTQLLEVINVGSKGS